MTRPSAISWQRTRGTPGGIGAAHGAVRSHRRSGLVGVAAVVFTAAVFTRATIWAGPVVASEQPRVVSLGGAITEVIYALHAENQIAGIDTTSLYPPAALKAKSNVGYVRSLSAEGILSLHPTMILAIPGAGPRDALALVRQTGVKIVTIPDDPTPEGVVRKIEAIGAALNSAKAAQTLAGDVTAQFKAIDALRAKITKPRRVLFLLSLQNGRSLVAGAKTSADGMIRLTGSINAATGFEGYKPMTDEAIAAAAPDVVLTANNTGSHVTSDALFALPAYASTPAAKGRALVAMDGLLLLGFGPRTPAAAQELIGLLYPSLAKTHP